MKLNFCTLFNSNYLSRGLALHQSLIEQCSDFHLYIFAFDDISYSFLISQKLKNVTVISLTEFEDEELLKLKPTRTATEYCWTCTPSTVLYCIKTFQLENCTYIDADMYFYDDPQQIWDEAPSSSVLITSHNYTLKHDHSLLSGIFCVQFVGFRNDENGMMVLNWWRDACNEWCYARQEDGKFGDQKYLDVWPNKFKGVHIVKSLGAGVAPWNVQQYSFDRNENTKKIKLITPSGVNFPVIFYHFHSMKFLADKKAKIADTEYRIPKDALNLIYKDYVKKIYSIQNEFELKKIGFDPNGTSSERSSSRFFYFKKNISKLSKHFVKYLIGRPSRFYRNYYNFIDRD